MTPQINIAMIVLHSVMCVCVCVCVCGEGSHARTATRDPHETLVAS